MHLISHFDHISTEVREVGDLEQELAPGRAEFIVSPVTQLPFAKQLLGRTGHPHQGARASPRTFRTRFPGCASFRLHLLHVDDRSVSFTPVAWMGQ